ncbi:chymotrypsin-2-like [Atheta coriaria]|uniref:chymotrypsin-2-like n=1 Tax=Dalotia coriaria TaxID=877792 RepID=UPI0031F39C5A
MKTIFITSFCVFLLFPNAQQFSIEPKIVGGYDADPGQFKYIASLRDDNNNHHFCGATIITTRTLISAAHCKVIDIDDMVAVVGTTRLDDEAADRYTVIDFITHPDYNQYGYRSDVAVIILDEDIEFTNMVQPIRMTSRRVRGDERLTSAGWGYTSFPGQAPNNLQWMNQNVVSAEECQEMEPGTNIIGKICALEMEGQGVCSGDSGGPLVDRYQELVGVTSSGFRCARGRPDFFTDVYYFKRWIEANIQ